MGTGHGPSLGTERHPRAVRRKSREVLVFPQLSSLEVPPFPTSQAAQEGGNRREIQVAFRSKLHEGLTRVYLWEDTRYFLISTYHNLAMIAVAYRLIFTYISLSRYVGDIKLNFHSNSFFSGIIKNLDLHDVFIFKRTAEAGPFCA